jgi:TPP-dependent pyruvate/acetoin dehydrogenase alpha subunit
MRATSVSYDLGPLADASEPVGPLDLAGVSTETALKWHDRMISIRLVEQAIAALVESGEARCPCHLAIGQEAVPVGVATALERGDSAFGAHRSHGHYLALGGGLEQLFAEVLGRDAGCSRGLGGSMHLRDASVGLLGTVPIVGATIPIAAGAALAHKSRGERSVAISFFGDGATEEGVFHETLNAASIMNLPVVFVCENNLFSSHMHISLRQPANSVARFAHPNLMAAAVVDGNDVGAVARAAAELIERSRAGGGPGLLEAVTYRWLGHVGHREDIDVGVRRKSDLAAWKRRDPIARLERALEERGVAARSLRGKVVDASTRVGAALDAARRSPYPPERLLYDAVLAGPAS